MLANPRLNRDLLQGVVATLPEILNFTTAQARAAHLAL
jgi:hypothetical protein